MQSCINLAKKVLPEIFMCVYYVREKDGDGDLLIADCVQRLQESCLPAAVTSNGSGTRKSFKEESCRFHVQMNFLKLFDFPQSPRGEMPVTGNR